MGKNYLNKNVYEAFNERMDYIFNEFDNILVAFSTGKDSSTMLNLTYDYAKKNNMLDKLSLYYMDYEADYEDSDKYAYEVFEKSFLDIKKKYWLCLPISAQCSVSMHQSYWIPWDKENKNIWVKSIPNSRHVVNEDNCPYKFEKGKYGSDSRTEFGQWFSSKYGKTAVFVGIRCDESLHRLSIVTSKRRVNMYKNKKYTKKIDNNTYNVYPIYDFSTSDIWLSNYKFNYTYNNVYNLMFMAGMSPYVMRIASPFHSCGQADLKLYKAISPNTWSKMVGRVNGVNFTNMYGGTTAMGWKNITKPDHFTWEEYADFLIKTLPAEFKLKLLTTIDRLNKSWSDRGYGRNPDVIKQMEKEGVELEYTGIESKLCTKDNYYEIVKIKNGFTDETKIPIFRKCPSWKGICISIMKNDYSLQYLGCSRTKKDIEKRKKIVSKYKEII